MLFPRLAFTFVQGNVLLIALKRMLRDFALFMGFAAVTFSGFFFALKALGSEWTSKSIMCVLGRDRFRISLRRLTRSAFLNTAGSSLKSGLEALVSLDYHS